MGLEQRTIVRCSKAAFWLGTAAIACGILSFAIFDAELFQIYLILAAVTIGMLFVLRLLARGPLNCAWATAAVAVSAGFLALSVFLIPLCAVINAGDVRIQTWRSMKQIANALLQYQKKHEHLPPAAIADTDGKPLLSWRVAILPFLGEEELYRQFNLNEPWDSPGNRGLLKRMPAVYQTPATPITAPLRNSTYFQALVGRGAAFEPGAKLQIPRDFPDGAAQTILIVEAANSVPWTKPEDTPFDPKGPLPPRGGILGRGGRFPYRFPWAVRPEGIGGFVALCDGDVRLISSAISDPTLRSAIIRNDGQPLGPDW